MKKNEKLLEVCLLIWNKCNDDGVQVQQAMHDICIREELDFQAVHYYYYQKFRKNCANFNHHHFNNKLTYAQVCKLILLVQSYARELTPLSTREVAGIVERHFQVRMSLQGIRSLLMRYSVDLRPGRTKPISAPRTNPSLLVDCNAFAEKWDALVNGGRLTQSALVTYDETVVGFNAGKWEAQRWMLPGEPNHTIGGKGLRTGSLIHFVSAAGEYLLAFGF